MKLIERDFYLEKLKNVVGIPDIKEITGVRRSGKSKLLEKFKNYIENNVSNLTSARNITNTLTSNKDTINHKTINGYIQYLCNAFAFYKTTISVVKSTWHTMISII